MSDDESQIVTDAGVGAALGAKLIDVQDRLIERAPTEGPTLIVLRDCGGGERVEEIVSEIGGLPMTRPGRIVTTVALETVSSLSAYASRFKMAGQSSPWRSTIFATIATDEIEAVLDYHDEGAGVGDFLGHRAKLKLKRSLEWSAWTGLAGKLLPQLEFVRFLEENREDIAEPDAATVLEACRDLQGLSKADFRSVVREDSDNYRIDYAESAEATPRREGVHFPTELVLRIPVYFDDAEIELRALIRWKVDDGKLTLGLVIKRAERVRQARFQQIVAELAAETGLQALFGSIAAAH